MAIPLQLLSGFSAWKTASGQAGSDNPLCLELGICVQADAMAKADTDSSP